VVVIDETRVDEGRHEVRRSLELTHSTMFSEQFLREDQQFNEHLDIVRPL